MSNLNKITFILESLPNPRDVGGAINLVWIIKSLVARGYKISIISFIGLNFQEPEYKKNIIFLKTLGVKDVKIIKGYKNNNDYRNIYFIFRPIFQILNLTKSLKINRLLLKEEINKSKNKLFFSFPDTLKYLSKYNSKIIIASFFGHNGYPFNKINYIFYPNKKFYTYMIFLIRNFFFKKAHFNSLEKITFGIGQPRFWINAIQPSLKTTRLYNVPAIGEPNISGYNKSEKKNKKIKVVMIGSPNSGLTKLGLMYFRENIWSYIKKNKIENDFEFNIIGRILKRYSLLDKLRHPSIKFSGFVDNIKDLIQYADIVLVPTNLAPGAGSKLSTIASYGGVLLVHKIVISSHHEYRDGFNCMAAGSGKDFVEKMILLKKNKELRKKLKKNIRKTYERFFTSDKFLNKLISLYVKYEKKINTRIN